MAIVLSFAPFILFVIIERWKGATAGLISAAVASALLLAWNVLRLRKPAKLLEVGTTILFGILTGSACLSKSTLSIVGIRMSVDVGLLVIVLGSIALRRPFTLQYAREQIAPNLWNNPEFIRANYIITAAWATAFFLTACADTILLLSPGLPVLFSIVVSVVALSGAARFTSWYPAYRRRLLTRPDN